MRTKFVAFGLVGAAAFSLGWWQLGLADGIFITVMVLGGGAVALLRIKNDPMQGERIRNIRRYEGR